MHEDDCKTGYRHNTARRFKDRSAKRIDLQRVKSYVKFICTFIAARSGSETPINKILITTTERHARIGDVADKLKLPIPIYT